MGGRGKGSMGYCWSGGLAKSVYLMYLRVCIRFLRGETPRGSLHYINGFDTRSDWERKKRREVLHTKCFIGNKYDILLPSEMPGPRPSFSCSAPGNHVRGCTVVSSTHQICSTGSSHITCALVIPATSATRTSRVPAHISVLPMFHYHAYILSCLQSSRWRAPSHTTSPQRDFGI